MKALPRLRRVLCLNDFEPLAQRRLPRQLHGFVAGGAEDQRAFQASRAAFDEWSLRTRVLVDVSKRSTQTKLFGRTWAAPFGIAPMGLASLCAYRGDLALAHAAKIANVPMILSGTALMRLEDVLAEAPQTWFQMYVPGDDKRIEALLRRVQAAGVRTLVVTVDVPVSGNRENDARRGFSTPLRPSLRLAVDGAVRPRWLFGTFARTLWRHGMPHFENSFAERGAPILSSNALRDFTARDHLSWAHIQRLRERWSGQLVLKGILSAEDAAMARSIGSDGIIVSNHGGRQLDHAAAPLRVLSEVVSAAAGMPVMLDGGVRRGTDVLKALALGAHFVFIGRPFLQAASVGGEAGVLHAIELLRLEVDRNQALLGVPNLRQLGPSFMLPKSEQVNMVATMSA